MLLVYASVLFLIAVWSYTLIDLNLTLLNWQPYLALQQQFIYLGYFNRPLNATIVSTLFFLLATYYVLYTSRTWTTHQLRNTILMTGVVLSLGYTAFSHDLFNYIFDARMITQYGANPYTHKALDFPQDEWIRFMQWTHRTYPYGPGWLLITVIPSFLGFGKFLLTYLLFKGLLLIAYLLGAWYVHKILSKLSTDTKVPLSGTALYAFNPLILIDGLLSPHLDLVMATIGLAGIYFIINNKHVTGWILILLSASIKFATLPWLLFMNSWSLQRYSPKLIAFFLFTSSFFLCILQAISQSNYQPWYGLLAAATLPILTPYIKMKYLVIAGILLTLPMWIYIHHAYTGAWSSAIPVF